MIEFVNKTTGTKMWVSETRKEEYLEAGHKLASENSKPADVSSDSKKSIKKTSKKK